MRKTVLRLSHTDWKVPEPLPGVYLDFVFSLIRQFDSRRAIHTLGDYLNLLDDAEVHVIEEAEGLGLLLTCGNNGLAQAYGTGAALGPMLAGESVFGTRSEGGTANKFKLFLSVSALDNIKENRVSFRCVGQRIMTMSTTVTNITKKENILEPIDCHHDR